MLSSTLAINSIVMGAGRISRCAHPIKVNTGSVKTMKTIDKVILFISYPSDSNNIYSIYKMTSQATLTIKHIQDILEKEIKPMLAMHLGSLDFVGFQDGVVQVRLQGTCKGCPLSQLTLKAGIEEILKSKVASVQKVEAVE